MSVLVLILLNSLLLCPLLCCTAISVGSLEIGTDNFIVGLLKDPLSLEDIALENPEESSKFDTYTVVEMVGANGDTFVCKVPSVLDATLAVEASAAATENVVAPVPVIDEKEQLAYVPTLIKQHHGEGCFTKKMGYWTYEVCPFAQVRQYHVEGTSETNILLGTYEDRGIEKELESGIYEHIYSGGDQSRKVKLKFICATDDKKAKKSSTDKSSSKRKKKKNKQHYADSLLAYVEEPLPRYYELTVTTNLVCNMSSGDPEQDMMIRATSVIANKCAQLNNGWWTYELCFSRKMSQFHKESQPIEEDKDAAKKDSKAPPATQQVTTASFSLGEPKTAMLELHRGKTWKDSYISQSYVGGDTCDVGTKVKRNTEVRLYCDPLAVHDLYVSSIDEYETCSYIVTAGSPHLCKEDVFAPEKPKMYEIVCAPKLSAPADIAGETDSDAGKPVM